MKRDVFGICLSQTILSEHLATTFTHVRVYRKHDGNQELKVVDAYPQMSGKELLTTMSGAREKALHWRAEHYCPSREHSPSREHAPSREHGTSRKQNPSGRFRPSLKS